MIAMRLYKKLLQFVMLCSILLSTKWCLGLQIGDVFEIKTDKFIPLFITDRIDLRYDVGTCGNNCYDLDTVLPPKTLIQVEAFSENYDTVHVLCKVSEWCTFQGYVHKNLLKCCTNPIPKNFFDKNLPNRPVLSVSEICCILDDCVVRHMPYSFGCNNYTEVPLGHLYSFDGPSKDCTQYRCFGFDCSGLLHYISGWTLPHSTRRLYDLFEKNCILSLGIESADAELQNALRLMKDTDYVVFVHDYKYVGGTGHVIISLHGGFVEAAGQSIGVIFTEKDHALERLRKLLHSARENGAQDVRIIRWHPELVDK